MERVDGIEPTYSAWKAAVLPLYYTRTETTAVLCFHKETSAADPHRKPCRPYRKRVVGEAGLEPAKLTQGIYSPPPLPLGTFPQRVFEPSDRCPGNLSVVETTKALGVPRRLV